MILLAVDFIFNCEHSSLSIRSIELQCCCPLHTNNSAFFSLNYACSTEFYVNIRDHPYRLAVCLSKYALFFITLNSPKLQTKSQLHTATEAHSEGLIAAIDDLNASHKEILFLLLFAAFRWLNALTVHGKQCSRARYGLASVLIWYEKNMHNTIKQNASHAKVSIHTRQICV